MLKRTLYFRKKNVPFKTVYLEGEQHFCVLCIYPRRLLVFFKVSKKEKNIPRFLHSLSLTSLPKCFHVKRKFETHIWFPLVILHSTLVCLACMYFDPCLRISSQIVSFKFYLLQIFETELLSALVFFYLSYQAKRGWFLSEIRYRKNLRWSSIE